MNKKLREQVRQKYNGRCAYCGNELSDTWQVDHKVPKRFFYIKDYGVNDPKNLLPSCKVCNHYKRAEGIDYFRMSMKTFHTRYAKLPKKPKVLASIKRIAYMQAIADAYGITPDKPFSGTFYFETLCTKQ